MAAFSYQHHHPFAALDPCYLPTPTPLDLHLLQHPQQHHHLQAGDLLPAAAAAAALSWFPCYYTPSEHPTAAVTTTAAPAAAVPTPESSSSLSSGHTAPSSDHRVPSSSCSSAQLSEAASRAPSPMEKKRKERQRQNSNDAKSRKQKKSSAPASEAEDKKKKKKKIPQEPPAGYIHVRARRGQATDSHSLAERARREKISERMKMLQGLVPGCDKVVGKALMLDEIINYVQSLQNQVEFLSMKLASVNPILYDSCCFDLDFMNGPEKLESMSPALLPVQQASSHTQPTAFVQPTATSCPAQGPSVPVLLHGQGPNAFPQGNGNSFVMQLGDNRQRFLNQDNACSFQ